MKKIEQKNHEDFIPWAERNTCNRVYPLSIAQNIQSGDIFADDIYDPGAVLFWHFCGFAYISGAVSTEFLEELISSISLSNKRRLALITDDDSTISFLEEKGFKTSKRIEYGYAGSRAADALRSDAEIRRIDEDIIHKISGRIVPAFSWEEKRFLQNGFGYAGFMDGKYCGAAFSSAVSSSEVDIGVEVVSEFRGCGIATTLVRRMCEEITAEGRKPVWAHAETNTASMKTALKSGFVKKKTNCFCIIKQEV